MRFCPDRDFIETRWRADASGTFAAERDGKLVGSNLATRWGSVGYFGPLTIHPDAWDSGVARRLLEATMDAFETWGTRHTGLFTFSHSTKHLHLYQKFGFWPRFLTPVMSLAVPPRPESEYTSYSALAPARRDEFLQAGLSLTDRILEGLDLRGEIRSVADQSLGDTVLVWDGADLDAFAVCHAGAGTEAGEGTCYVKFAAARGGGAFERLLSACEAYARDRGLGRIEAGVNTARHDACRAMMARGFRAEVVGVTMHRSNDPGYSRPDVFVIDDWR